MAESGLSRNYVPVYWEGGVTIGRARIADDNCHIIIELNEGVIIGEQIKENLVGLNTFSLATNDALPSPVVQSEDERIVTRTRNLRKMAADHPEIDIALQKLGLD